LIARHAAAANSAFDFDFSRRREMLRRASAITHSCR
jgi:hypothetical protein